MPKRSRRHAVCLHAGKGIVAVALVLATPGLPGGAVRAQQATPGMSRAAREAFVDSLLARMTIQEKAGQLNQPRAMWREGQVQITEELRSSVRAGRIGSFLGVPGVAITEELQRIAVEESRLGIPPLFAHDVIHGFRTEPSTPSGRRRRRGCSSRPRSDPPAARRRGREREPPREAACDLACRAGILQTRPASRLTTGVRATYIGSQIVLSERFSGQRVKLDPYVLINLRGEYEMPRRVAFYARVDNLFDVEYETAFDRIGVPFTFALGVQFAGGERLR